METSRETRFRGLSKLGKWIVGDLVRHPLGKAFIIQYKHTSPLWIEVNPESIGEFTGMKDKDGTDIYEGDILQIRTDPPMWESGRDSFEVHRHECGMWWIDAPNVNSLLYYTLECDCKVIGNIHENSDRQ